MPTITSYTTRYDLTLDGPSKLQSAHVESSVIG
jgi:hypothetical protein